MTLAVLVASSTLLFWLLILVLRWLHVAPSTQSTATRSSSRRPVSAAPTSAAASRLSGQSFATSASGPRRAHVLHLAGNLPPGVDEDDLVVFLVIGMGILIVQEPGARCNDVRCRAVLTPGMRRSGAVPVRTVGGRRRLAPCPDLRPAERHKAASSTPPRPLSGPPRAERARTSPPFSTPPALSPPPGCSAGIREFVSRHTAIQGQGRDIAVLWTRRLVGRLALK